MSRYNQLMNIKPNQLRKTNTREPGLYGSDLKWIAVITMIIDHIGAAIVQLLPGIHDATSMTYLTYWILRLVGRLAFPIYCFFIVEGLTYSKNKVKYSLRLLLFCVLSEIPFDLAIHGQLIDWSYQNVFWTLLIGLLAMCGFEYIRKHEHELSNLPNWKNMVLKYSGLLFAPMYFSYKSVDYLHKIISIAINNWILYLVMWIVWVAFFYSIINNIAIRKSTSAALTICVDIMILALAMCVSDLAHTDYSAAGIMTITVMYLFRSNYYQRILAGCVALTAMTNPSELMTFITLPLILRYNGKRGSSIKYFFYVVYPLHLIILYVIVKWGLKLR